MEFKKRPVLALGTFDGLHPGHRAVIAACAQKAACSSRTASGTLASCFHDHGQGRQQQELHLAARGAQAPQAGRQHPRVVGDKQGAFGKQIAQLGEHAVLYAESARPVHDHEPRGATTFGGNLRDALFGELVVVAFQQQVLGIRHPFRPLSPAGRKLRGLGWGKRRARYSRDLAGVKAGSQRALPRPRRQGIKKSRLTLPPCQGPVPPCPAPPSASCSPARSCCLQDAPSSTR